jgi:hypothetical protein
MMYPLLGIERGNIAPEEVYFSINGEISPEDRKLICVYDPNANEAYSNFKQESLVNHVLLCDEMTNENGYELFIFDMNGFATDWDYFLEGSYSKISENVKSKIQNYFEKNSANYIYMNSFLYPEKWHKRYSELLDVSESLLTEVVELTDKPDFERETFHFKPVVTELETHRIAQKINSHQCDRCNNQGIIPRYMHIANGVCFKCYGSSKSKVMVA